MEYTTLEAKCMLRAGIEGSPYSQIILGRAMPSGVDTGMIAVPQQVKAPGREGVIGVIDAAAVHVTSVRTDGNRHLPRVRGAVSFGRALETEIRRAYGGGGLIYEEAKPYIPLAEMDAARKRIANGQGDPDPEQELFNTAKEALLARAKVIYPAFFSDEASPRTDTGIDPGGHESDVDSDARVRKALQERIAARKPHNI